MATKADEERAVCFVAGASGYLGRHFTEAASSSFRVIAVGRDPRRMPSGVEFIDVDLLAGQDSFPSLSRHEHRVLVHLIGSSRESVPGDIYRANVRTTEMLLSFARRHRVRRVVYVSGFGVSHASQSVYFRAKASAEDLVLGSGLSAAVVRPSYVLGGPDELTPSLLRCRADNMPFVIPGDGSYRIQPIFVGQFVEILLRLADVGCVESGRIDTLGPTVAFGEFIRDYARRLGCVEDVVHGDLMRFIRSAVVDVPPVFTLSQLGILLADRIGIPTVSVCGVELFDYDRLLDALAAAAPQ